MSEIAEDAATISDSMSALAAKIPAINKPARCAFYFWQVFINIIQHNIKLQILTAKYRPALNSP
jgi:hypothetical protein